MHHDPDLLLRVMQPIVWISLFLCSIMCAFFLKLTDKLNSKKQKYLFFDTILDLSLSLSFGKKIKGIKNATSKISNEN